MNEFVSISTFWDRLLGTLELIMCRNKSFAGLDMFKTLHTQIMGNSPPDLAHENTGFV